VEVASGVQPALASRTLLLALVILVTAAAQSAVVPHLALFGARPDLPLLLTVMVGLLGGPIAGMSVGFAAGLLQGALDATSPGGAAAVFTLAGYLAGALRARLFFETWLVPAAVVGVFTLAVQGARGLLWRPEGWVWSALLATLAGGALYNAVLAVPAFALARRSRRLLPGAQPPG